MGEVLEEAVDEGSSGRSRTTKLRPALAAQDRGDGFDEGKDLEFDLKLEVLPEIPEVDPAIR